MTLAIQKQQATGVTNDTLDEKMRWCQVLADGDLLPSQYRNKPANLLYAIEYADALGIPRVNALTSIHVIEGKPTASADLMASMVRKAGHKLRVSAEGTGTKTTATAQIIRADDPDFTFSVTWTWTDVLNAGLENKANWQKYPAAMMKARAISAVVREGASDAMRGVIYTPEELGAVVDSDGNPVKAMTSNNPTRAEATIAHPLQKDAPPADTPARPDVDIAADIAVASDDRDKVKDLWREARRAGYVDLVEDTNALMGGNMTVSQFGEKWVMAQLPLDEPGDEPGGEPDDGDVVDGELMPDGEGEH